MNRKALVSFFVVPLLLFMAGVSMARVNVDINIDLPPVFSFAEPPELVVIPNTYVYYAPGVDLDIVFYHGFWYRPYNGHWFRASGYNGPWHRIGRDRMPRYILNLPPDYRSTYRSNPLIPYRHVHDNWRHWEKERYWHKREWRHERNEWQQERRKDRRERREDGRERREDGRERREDRREHREDRRERR